MQQWIIVDCCTLINQTFPFTTTQLLLQHSLKKYATIIAIYMITLQHFHHVFSPKHVGCWGVFGGWDEDWSVYREEHRRTWSFLYHD